MAKKQKKVKKKQPTIEDRFNNLRAEMDYVMDKLAKDRMSKRLLPYYSMLVSTLKRSQVFVSNDALQGVATQVNTHLNEIQKSFIATDEKIKAQERRIEELEKPYLKKLVRRLRTWLKKSQ